MEYMSNVVNKINRKVTYCHETILASYVPGQPMVIPLKVKTGNSIINRTDRHGDMKLKRVIFIWFWDPADHISRPLWLYIFIYGR